MPGSHDLSECMDCLCLASRSASRAISQVYDRHLRGYGLRSTQFSLLTNLILRGKTPMGLLAKALGMDRTTLTRNLALLESNGWVQTSADDKDARTHLVAATRAGEKLAREALPGWRKAQAEMAELIGPTGVAGLKRLARASVP